MSLAINVDAVSAVLIGNKWFTVELDRYMGRSTFELDAYEFHYPHPARPDGDPERWIDNMHEKGSTCTGFSFRHKMKGAEGAVGSIYGPITAIQAIQEMSCEAYERLRDSSPRIKSIRERDSQGVSE